MQANVPSRISFFPLFLSHSVSVCARENHRELLERVADSADDRASCSLPQALFLIHYYVTLVAIFIHCSRFIPEQ